MESIQSIYDQETLRWLPYVVPEDARQAAREGMHQKSHLSLDLAYAWQDVPTSSGSIMVMTVTNSFLIFSVLCVTDCETLLYSLCSVLFKCYRMVVVIVAFTNLRILHLDHMWWHMHLIQALSKQRKADLCASEASLVCISEFRPARAI